MKKMLIAAALAFSPPASAATFNVDATWATPTVGFATNIEPDDQSGSMLGESIDFSSVALFPHPMSVFVDTPNFGDITLNFTSVSNFFVNAAGIFYSMTGIDSAGSLDLMTAVIAPADGTLRFEVEGFGFSDLPPPPPPPPPPCCDAPPPPCCAPPPGVAVPETSTWLMLLAGLSAIGFLKWRRA
jgi:hypothetical protein